VCAGRLIFRGTRIRVADVLALLDSGYGIEEASQQYRGAVSAEAIREARALIRRGVVREIPPRRAA